MKEAILDAMKECALRYSKGYKRWDHLWDEKLTVEQKAEDIASMLDAMGYKLVKTKKPVEL